MNAIPSVVVATDGKHDAPVLFAIDEARRRKAPLRVVHCTPIPLAKLELGLTHVTFADLLNSGQALLDKMCALAQGEGPDLMVEGVLLTDDPEHALVVQSSSAQLLVLGNDEVSWLSRAAGGAVADHVAAHSRCPVVVVPPDDMRTGRHGGLVAALDGNSAARPLLRLAFDIGQERGCTIHALRAVPAEASGQAADHAHADLGEVLAGWSQDYPDVRVVSHVVFGTPDEEVLDTARYAELVLIGRSKDRGLKRTTVANVLRHATCPVGVVPLDESHV